MLENIKASYFIQLLFSYLSMGKELRIINYNKSFQKIMGLNIMDYKQFSGRFIIYEDNGIAKEYNSINNCLVFEGEYLNGKRNGKEKQYYYNGKLQFEGEYLNGERNGKGKEYDDGKLVFEGEYLN